jgi:hypothetical protein
MRGVLAIVIAAIAAALVLTSASAGPPPQPEFHFGATHAKPIAGKSFTGITVGYIATSIEGVRCHASIGGKELHARQERFYEAGIAGPEAVSCSWQLPKAAAGKHLRAWARAYNPDGGFEGSGYAAWLVRP